MNSFTLPETTKGRTYKAFMLALHMLRTTEGFNDQDSRYLWMIDVFLDLHDELVKEAQNENRTEELVKSI